MRKTKSFRFSLIFSTPPLLLKGKFLKNLNQKQSKLFFNEKNHESTEMFLLLFFLFLIRKFSIQKKKKCKFDSKKFFYLFFFLKKKIAIAFNNGTELKMWICANNFVFNFKRKRLIIRLRSSLFTL